MPAWKLVGLESRLGSSHQIAWTNDNELCPQAIVHSFEKIRCDSHVADQPSMDQEMVQDHE